MALIATDSGGGGFDPIPEGTHLAVCVRIIDLGTQPGSVMYPARKHRVRFYWEVPAERIEFEGKDSPRLATKEYTLSLNEKAAMCKDLQAWRGRKFTDAEKAGFELRNVLGHACMITVAHNTSGGNTYANVVGVSGIPKGMAKPQAEGELVYWEIEDGMNDVYGAFSDALKTKIAQADEWSAPAQGEHPDEGHAPPPPHTDDDIPFMRRDDV